LVLGLLALVALLTLAPAGAKTVKTVRLFVGDDFQSIVINNPPGTTFIVGAGEHRMQQVVPMEGDSFIGELDPKGKLLSILNGLCASRTGNEKEYTGYMMCR
jgi:hypothetical protein